MRRFLLLAVVCAALMLSAKPVSAQVYGYAAPVPIAVHAPVAYVPVAYGPPMYLQPTWPVPAPIHSLGYPVAGYAPVAPYGLYAPGAPIYGRPFRKLEVEYKWRRGLWEVEYDFDR